MKKTIVGKALPNIPWQKKPKGCTDVVWRYDKNPVIDRKPIKDSSRVFNSAIIPYKNEFRTISSRSRMKTEHLPNRFCTGTIRAFLK
jgi:hypothetical protein